MEDFKAPDADKEAKEKFDAVVSPLREMEFKLKDVQPGSPEEEKIIENIKQYHKEHDREIEDLEKNLL